MLHMQSSSWQEERVSFKVTSHTHTLLHLLLWCSLFHLLRCRPSHQDNQDNITGNSKPPHPLTPSKRHTVEISHECHGVLLLKTSFLDLVQSPNQLKVSISPPPLAATPSLNRTHSFRRISSPFSSPRSFVCFHSHSLPLSSLPHPGPRSRPPCPSPYSRLEGLLQDSFLF